MATIAQLAPGAAVGAPNTFRARFFMEQAREILKFSPIAQESAIWQFIAPQGLDTSTFEALIFAYMDTATTGDIDLEGSIEAISDPDTIDMGGAESFDTLNSSLNNSVPGTAGHPMVITITLTNDDGIAAGDLVRFKLKRDSADTAAGDFHMVGGEIRDAQ